MKKNTLLLACLLPALLSAAQYKAIDGKSLIKFTIKNFGMPVGGTFTGLEANITFDPANLTNAAFKVSVDANTVNTENELRDEHLKGESYFNTAHYPRISFESTKIAAATGGAYTMVGRLTIKNHTQEISFPFVAEPAGAGYLFKGAFTINRKDFDVGGFSIIADNAEIMLSVFAGK